MNKIMKALLEAKYPTTNVELLMDVVSATPNPELATEILAGLYEEPVVSKECKESFGPKTYLHDIQFMLYDKWSNSVHYSYYRKKSATIWKLRTMDMPLFEDITKAQTEYYFKDFVNKSNVDTGIKLEDENLYHKVTCYGEPQDFIQNTNCPLHEWQ